MSDRRRGSPAGRFVGPAGLQHLRGDDSRCPWCGAENDAWSAHCVACGRRLNAPEAGNEGLGDSVAAPATEGDVWSMYATAAGATSTTGPSETTRSDVAEPLPPPSGPRGDVLPAPGSADVSSPDRVHGDNRTPELLERSNRPRSTLPLVALGAAVAVVLACVGLALAVRFGAGDDEAATGSLGGDTQATTAVSSRSVSPTTVAAVDSATTAAPRRAWPPPFRWFQHPVRRRRPRVRSPRRPARHRPSRRRARFAAARLAATVRCCHNPQQQRRRQRARGSAAIGDAQRRLRAVLVGRAASCGHVGVRRLEHRAQSRSRLGNGQRRGAGRWIRQPGSCDASTRRCPTRRRQRSAAVCVGRQRACRYPDDAVLRPVHGQLDRARTATVGERLAAVLGHQRARGCAGEPGRGRSDP